MVRQWLAACLVGISFVTFVLGVSAAETYPSVKPMQKVIDVPDVAKADVSLVIRSLDDQPLYKLQCHSRGYVGDPDFDYSGDFECRLSLVHGQNVYSTLLTEDAEQSRDWESRGRFFSGSLRGPCAAIPEFGASRAFKLRRFDLTLTILDPKFNANGKLISLRLGVTVRADGSAQRQIAEAVPIPRGSVSTECRLAQYFVSPSALGKEE